MRPNKYKNTIAAFFFLLSIFPLYGQFNVRVGYNLGITNPGVHQQIYQQFNQNHPWLATPFKDYRTLHGMQLGLRYTFEDFLALEAVWHNQYHRQAVSGTNPLDNTDFSQSISFRFSSLGLGFENFIGPVSFGASINYDILEFNTKIIKQDKFKFSEENGWSSHFFVGYNFEGNKTLKFSLRPYVHMLWHTVDLKALHEVLNPGDPAEQLSEDYSTFGIMLVFYNGN